jgi:hypothetical protein
LLKAVEVGEVRVGVVMVGFVRVGLVLKTFEPEPVVEVVPVPPLVVGSTPLTSLVRCTWS